MLRNRTGFVPVLLAATLVSLSFTASFAQTSNQSGDAADKPSAEKASNVQRLNLIDRQRMLAEMMAKGLCLIDLRVNKKLHRNQMSAAQFVFHSTLDNLRDGNEALSIAPETVAERKQTIDGLKAAWVNYAEPLNSWTGGRWGKKQFALKVYEVSEDYAKLIKEAIEQYRKTLIDEGDISSKSAKTILSAGRQRALSQRIAKQFCQSLSGYKPDEINGRLKENLAKFKDVTEKFAAGDAAVGLEGQQPGMVVDVIENARATLSPIEPIIAMAVDGQKPSQEELDLVASSTLQLLRHWEKITATYVVLAKN
ncbi:MAG: type IV pili methyl-accepting chemotaxis transducer N-terminal domain-containing protein [Filomicrobium sp.]